MSFRFCTGGCAARCAVVSSRVRNDAMSAETRVGDSHVGGVREHVVQGLGHHPQVSAQRSPILKVQQILGTLCVRDKEM